MYTSGKVGGSFRTARIGEQHDQERRREDNQGQRKECRQIVEVHGKRRLDDVADRECRHIAHTIRPTYFDEMLTRITVCVTKVGVITRMLGTTRMAMPPVDSW